MTRAITPPPEGTVFTRDPVLVTTAFFTFVLGVISILLIADVFSEQVGGVLAGIATAAWTAVQLLFVKPATVPRQPLAELAYETAQHTAPTTPPTGTDPITIDTTPTKGSTSG